LFERVEPTERIKAMKFMIWLALVFVSATASAGDLTAIAGHYTYTDYSVSLPSGRVMHLEDLGAVSATLDISESNSLTLRMVMRSGQVVTETAKIVEIHFANGSGYWLAQWPDMTYPVKALISVRGSTLSSVTKFEKASDSERFGSVENATLTKARAP
jgi:hypothetical protein